MISRRRFIGTGAALAGASALAGFLPENLLRATKAGASGSFNLSQVKHIVYLMQENRSFDHYFGAFSGVRGYSDSTAVILPNGNTVFQQPDPDNPDGYVEPFHLDTIATGAAATPSLSHAWEDQHASLNGGAMDGWIRTHNDVDGIAKGTYTMGYYTGADIPFHWALAQNFALLDNYHCAVLGPTWPNRIMWLTGTNDPQGTLGKGPALDNNASGYTWITAPELLLAKGYTFKCYNPPSNSGLNMLQEFSQISGASSSNPTLYQGVFSAGTLWGNGSGGLGNPASPTAASNTSLAFEQDCANGTLPDVSWIFPSSAASEHPAYLPAAGAQFLASKLEALAGNETLWNETVFIINYDENDGYFDHVVPPTPSQAQYPTEFVTATSRGGTPGMGYPVGGGFRVPCFIVSPWTVGGNPYHAVADHTSCLRFLEQVTAAGGLNLSGGSGGITVANISPWRRATFDDLTGAFASGTAAAAAPTNAQFNASTTAANLSAQTAASSKPLPAFPGANQTMPA
jgi:phospholipase C